MLYNFPGNFLVLVPSIFLFSTKHNLPHILKVLITMLYLQLFVVGVADDSLLDEVCPSCVGELEILFVFAAAVPATEVDESVAVSAVVSKPVVWLVPLKVPLSSSEVGLVSGIVVLSWIAVVP